MEVLVGGAVLGWAARKYHKREKKKRAGADYDYEHETLRSVMSLLVHGVYFRDLDGFGDMAATFLGFQSGRAENYGKRHWEPFRPWEIDSGELKKLGLEFLLRKDPHPNDVAPSLAILLRGTIPHKGRDLVADVKISFGLLHKTDRIRRSQELIWEVVQAFLRNYGTAEQICLAGHSLGGAMALQVGRNLVSSHGIAIDTHLFNPPLLTLVDFATLGVLPRPNAPHNQLGNQRLGEEDVAQKQIVVRRPDQQGLLRQICFPGNGALDTEWRQFQELEVWVPHFYLNPGDVVCHRYIKFYKKRHQMATTAAPLISPQGIFTRLLGKDAKYIADVVPSADLNISIWEKGNPVLAHSIRQWHKYTDEKIGLDRFQARLLPHTRRRLTRAHEIGRTMLHDGRVRGSDTVAAVKAAAASYKPFSQAVHEVAGYEALLQRRRYKATEAESGAHRTSS